MGEDMDVMAEFEKHLLGGEKMTRSLRVYVSSPYWHKKAVVRQGRARAVTEDVMATMALVPPKMAVFYSPIMYTRGFDPYCVAIRNLSQYWEEVEQAVLPTFDALFAIKYGAWEDSAGMKREWEMAEELGMPRVQLDRDQFRDWFILERHLRECRELIYNQEAHKQHEE